MSNESIERIITESRRERFEKHFEDLFPEDIRPNMERNECGYVCDQVDAMWVGYQLGWKHADE